LGHIKLIDFGLAKANISDKILTATFCGTNEYIRITNYIMTFY